LVGFLAAAFSFTSSITNSLIYSSLASDEAAASGHLFLSIVNVYPTFLRDTISQHCVIIHTNISLQILWVFYFGTTPQAGLHSWVDSYAISRSRQQPFAQTPIPTTPPMQTQFSATAPLTSLTPIRPQTTITNPQYSSSLPVNRDTLTADSSIRGDSVVEEPTSYPHRAKAIYAYEADMKDPNEVSFAKGEILEVSADITSKWWTVRKVDGTKGIAPSNYLSLES
jgi:SHO1 osmosensor